MHKIIFALFLVSCASQKPETVKTDWKEKSKKLTHDYAVSLAPLAPESVARLGFDQFGHFTTPFSKDYLQERYVHSYHWKNRLERMLETETHEEMKTDIRILLDKVSMDMEDVELTRSEGIVPFMPVTEFIYFNLKNYLYKDAPKKLLNNGLSRFRYYVRGDEEQLPIMDGYMAYMLTHMKHLADNRKRGFWPLRTEVETYLKDSDSYLSAIESHLAVWKSDEWKRDFEELKRQDHVFREFLKKKVLPYTRKTNLTPYNIFAFTLRDMGIKETPQKLIEVSKNDYSQTYLEFSQLAREIADEKKLARKDPVSVIQYLTSQKISDNNELLKLYKKSNEELFQIVTKNNILTVKERPNLEIRFATEAEAKSIPAPHFNNAPFFGQYKNRPAEFVITPTGGGRDDFSFREAVTTLTAHEAMPGHALQYHVMRERGTTLMRAWLAFNSVNAEGWGLYAEDLVYPYLDKETKFVSLQRRLWRQARMFLDPELNLGKINGQRVLDVYMKELGFSRLFAESELNRYSYIMPGQANAYYYGYKKLMQMKAKVSDPKCFNDAVLDVGILPLDEINVRIEKLKCGAR